MGSRTRVPQRSIVSDWHRMRAPNTGLSAKHVPPDRHFCVHGGDRNGQSVWGTAVRQLLGVAMGEQTSVAGGEDETLDLPCATSLEIPGRTIERYVGLCWGLTVRSVGFSKGITGAVRSLKAGEVAQYTNVVEQARHHALQRLVEHARAQGANAVIGVRFDSSEVGQQLSEIVAYGTAVVIAPAS